MSEMCGVSIVVVLGGIVVDIDKVRVGSRRVEFRRVVVSFF